MASLALERIVRSPAALVENLPIGIYTCDRDGMVVQYNRRAAELWGRTPEPSGFRYCGALRLSDCDDATVAPGESPVAEVLANGQPARDRELRMERANGEVMTILVNVDPIFDEDGGLVGAVTCFQDITDMSRLRRRMSEGRRVARHVMEALPVALYTTDAEGRLLFYNKAAEAMWGRAPKLGEEFWCGSYKILTPEGALLPHELCPMAVALKEKRAVVGPEAVAERPDGSRVPFLPYPTPIFDSAGTMIGAVNMLLDLTSQKQASAQQRGLIDELNHRVKNTLATIQALATQTMRGSTDEGARAFEARLLALSRVHDQLSAHAWEWADLRTIAEETFAPLRGSANNAVHVDGAPLRLKPKTALALAMVLHELAANAGHHGALSTPAGSLRLDWRKDGTRLHLEWREQGGPAVQRPRSRGFGSRLLERSIAQELGGKVHIDYAAAGVHCTMDIPLPE